MMAVVVPAALLFRYKSAAGDPHKHFLLILFNLEGGSGTTEARGRPGRVALLGNGGSGSGCRSHAARALRGTAHRDEDGGVAVCWEVRFRVPCLV